jgi:hypothetical protein
MQMSHDRESGVSEQNWKRTIFTKVLEGKRVHYLFIKMILERERGSEIQETGPRILSLPLPLQP